jgi:thiamine-phosphate pyrophosphorylase
MQKPDRFYPIVDSLDLLERIAALGVSTIQLRMKGLNGVEADQLVGRAVAVTRARRSTLVVNDYWRAAIKAGAAWVHLGQEDLASADIAEIRAAGLKIGISTHDEGELRIALTHAPDYVALGPIFQTSSKTVRFSPQGLSRLGAWKRHVGAIPLVAIGGITLENAAAVLAAGADSVAVLGDLATCAHPPERVRSWLAAFPSE